VNNFIKQIAGQLTSFAEINYDLVELNKIMRHDSIEKICIFVLGPEGTNISQAAEKWILDRNIGYKSNIILCDSPEKELEKAKEISDSKTFPVFVLCAVYNRLFELYFSNPDSYFFMDHYYMKLDNMLFATNKYSKKNTYKVVSHPSPAVLLNNLENIDVTYANSNSFSAKLCKSGEADMCITTESGRRLNDLKSIHKFGSPTMLFTFGTTLHGVKMLRKIGGMLDD